MASALVIFSLGDAAAQYIEYNQSSSPNIKTTAPPPPKPFQFDLLRMNEMILWSVGFYTPVLYQFYRWMDHRWPKVTPLNVIRKVGGAFLLAAPLNAGFFAYGVAYPYIISTYVTGTRSEIPTEIIKKEAQDKINAELINTMKASASLWWPVNALNFALVPGQFRAIWTSAWSVAWSTYLSLVQHRDFDETDEGAVVKLMRKLTKRDNKQDTGAGVSGCHETWFVQSEQSQFEGAEGERFEQVREATSCYGGRIINANTSFYVVFRSPSWRTSKRGKCSWKLSATRCRSFLCPPGTPFRSARPSTPCSVRR